MEEGFLGAIHDDPADATSWLILADWLDETDQPARAEFVRLRQQLTRQIDFPERQAAESRLQGLLLDGIAPPVPRLDVDLGDDVILPLVLVPPGVFLMGSPDREPDRFENESPRHQVTLSRGFYLGVTPTTQRQWQALMGNNPSQFIDLDRPVETVSWPECQSFCEKLSSLLRRPCRLPYEAEWEYACRAGTQSPFYLGKGQRAMRKAGWCSRGNSGSAQQTRQVGLYLPNAFGLHDMHGNVREWCQDDLRRYTARSRIDPQGSDAGGYRVVRGGSWYYGPEDSRSACRYSRPIDYHLDYYGFRVAVPCQ